MKRKDLLENGAVVQQVTDSTEVLGYIISFSIGDAMYKRENMEQSLIKHGLDLKYLPSPVNPADAFARAAKECEIKSWRASEDSKEYKNFTVRDVVRAGKKRIKHIVVETVNAERERLDYDPEGAILQFDTDTGIMSTQVNDPTCTELVDNAEIKFQQYLSAHNGNTVRGSIMKLLNSKSTILMRLTGGVYFVPIQYEQDVHGMVGYINSLEKGDAFALPMANTAERQSLVKLRLQQHLQGVLDKCREAIHSHNNPIDKKTSFRQKEAEKEALDLAIRAVAQFKDYQAILTGEMTEVETAYELVKSSIKTMTEELLISPIKKRK